MIFILSLYHLLLISLQILLKLEFMQRIFFTFILYFNSEFNFNMFLIFYHLFEILFFQFHNIQFKILNLILINLFYLFFNPYN